MKRGACTGEVLKVIKLTFKSTDTKRCAHFSLQKMFFEEREKEKEARVGFYITVTRSGVDQVQCRA